MKRTLYLLLSRKAYVAAATIAVFLSHAVHAAQFRAVALGGQDASAAIPGAALSTFMGPPSLNNNGEAAFFAYLVPPAGSSDVLESLWTSHPTSGLTPVAWQGQTPPGANPQAAYEQFFPSGGQSSFEAKQSVIPINDAGDIVFRGQLLNTATRKFVAYGYWRRTNGVIQAIAQDGDTPPGTPANFKLSNLLTVPLLTNDGRAWLVGYLREIVPTTFSGGMGMWSGTNDQNLELIAGGHYELPFPGDPTLTYNLFDSGAGNDTGQTYSVNDQGVAVAAVRVFDPNSLDRVAILRRDPVGGQLTPLMMPGTAAPGFPVGFQFLDGFTPRINNSGQVAFTAFVRDLSGNQSGLWTGTNASDLHLLARQGAPAPGASGQNFSFFRPSPVINAQGQIAFSASLSGNGSSAGLWRVDQLGSVTPVMIPGQIAPGTLAQFTSANTPAINALGQIAFLGAVNDQVNNLGIWATDLAGELRLVARKGQFIDIDPTDRIDSRRILDLYFIGDSGNEDGRASAFNDRGEIAFRAWLSDGATTTWAILTVNTIPEPTSRILLVPFGLAALRLRRVLGTRSPT